MRTVPPPRMMSRGSRSGRVYVTFRVGAVGGQKSNKTLANLLTFEGEAPSSVASGSFRRGVDCCFFSADFMSALIKKSIEETIAMEVASYSTSKRLQIYRTNSADTSYCLVDFSRHENSPTGQVTATRYSYIYEDMHLQSTVKHHPFVLKTRQAVDTYIRILDIFVGGIACFVVQGEALPNCLEDYRIYFKVPKTIHSMVLEDSDPVVKKNRELLVDAIWDLVANH